MALTEARLPRLGGDQYAIEFSYVMDSRLRGNDYKFGISP
jgi:hypothetical protein